MLKRGLFLLMIILTISFVLLLVNVSWAQPRQVESENVTVSFGDTGFLNDPRLTFVPPM